MFLTALSFCALAQPHRLYNELSFYVAAHQDDWQLFMGSNAFNDITSFNETSGATNGKKVVIIYTTAGNLNDSDDTKTCNCRDPFDKPDHPFPYWKVREEGAKHSVHFAACKIGGWGAGIPYPKNNTVTINGHRISRYEYKNTVSYFLRTNAGSYSQWYYKSDARVGTVDNSTTYVDYTDFVNTLYYIFKTEKDSSITSHAVNFNFPDINEDINKNDHHDHLIAGRGACEASKMLSKINDTCYKQLLFTDYHSQNMPVNLSSPDIQNEAALTAVYCLALLDYNAWPEWGSIYQEWTCRNYFRTTTTCDSAVNDSILVQDSLEKLTVRVFPSPANTTVFVRFNIPVRTDVEICIFDSKGIKQFNYNGPIQANNFPINTSMFAPGYYLVSVKNGSASLTKTMVEVIH